MRLIDADMFKEDVLSGLYIYLQENKEDIARAIDNAPTVEPYNKDETYIRGYDDGFKDALRDAKKGSDIF